MTEELATLKTEGDVSMITFDDGKANVFSLAMSQTIEKLLDEVSDDKGALLLIGRPGMFSAGFDLKVMSSGDGEAVQEMVKGGFKLLRRIYSFPRPVVAACSGHGIALGAFILLCSDYRIGAEGEFIIGANEIRNNMSIPEPILEIAKSRLTKTHWYRAILNAEMYPMSEAIAPGYLDELVKPEKLKEIALGRATDLATLGHPVYQITKELDQEEILKRIDSGINSMP